MRLINKFTYLLFFSVLVCCKDNPKPEKDVANSKPSEKEFIEVPESWIENRVEKTKAKLASSEAGKVVWNAMEAHGGLKKWFSNGPLSFRFNYQPLDGSTVRDSYQTIDTWSNKAKHTSVLDSAAQFGWTGEKAWVMAKDSTAFKYDTKFWALTPFYFLAQPFVLSGEGVNLELLPETTFKDNVQDVVKVTFDAGTGDAPDDYYILYFDKVSHTLGVIRYIVSYPEYFKDGGHAPEKFMEVIGEVKVDGILFPTNYKTYWLADNAQPGEHITNIDVSEIAFEPQLPKDFFDVPENTKILNE